jgi:hypothetical protein
MLAVSSLQRCHSKRLTVEYALIFRVSPDLMGGELNGVILGGVLSDLNTP